MNTRIRVFLLLALGVAAFAWHLFSTPDDAPKADSEQSKEQEKLKELIWQIENRGKPNRQMGIVQLRAYLKSRDPSVRYGAARMLYEMKDRSGFETLLNLLKSPQPVLSGGVDWRFMAAHAFAHYREHQADEAIMSQYAKTRLENFKWDALRLQIPAMVRFFHVSMKEQLWEDSIEGLAVLAPKENEAFFKKITDNERQNERFGLQAVFGLARAGSDADLERLMSFATPVRREKLPGNQVRRSSLPEQAAIYLTYFRGDRIVKFFEELLKSDDPDAARGVALAYLRYHHPENQASREIIKAALSPGGWELGYDYTFLLQLVRLSGDPGLIAVARKTDETVTFRELDVRAGWSNAWLGDLLPDWEGDWK